MENEIMDESLWGNVVIEIVEDNWFKKCAVSIGYFGLGACIVTGVLFASVGVGVIINEILERKADRKREKSIVTTNFVQAPAMEIPKEILNKLQQKWNV